jgi:hypothetical protein
MHKLQIKVAHYLHPCRHPGNARGVIRDRCSRLRPLWSRISAEALSGTTAHKRYFSNEKIRFQSSFMLMTCHPSFFASS